MKGLRIGRRRGRDSEVALSPLELALRPALVDGRWQIPDRFNFTRDVVEALARDPKRRAADLPRQGRRHRAPELPRDRRRRGRLGDHAARAAASAPGDRVVVMDGNTVDWLEIVLGVMKTGAVVVPVHADRLRRRSSSGSCRRPTPSSSSRSRSLEPTIERMGFTPDVHFFDARGRSGARRTFPRRPTHDTASRDLAFIVSTTGVGGTREGRRAHARLGVRDTRPGRALARRRPRRRRLVHDRCRLAADDVEHRRRAVVARRRGRAPRGRVRRRRASRSALQTRAEHPLPVARRVPRARRAPEARALSLASAPPARLDGRLPRSRGRRRVRGALGPDDLRRLRPGRDEHRRREPRGRRSASPGSIGRALPGHHVAIIDDQGNELPAGIEGDLADPRTPADAVRRLLGAAGGDEVRLPRRLVPDRRRRARRRGGLLHVRRSRGGRHHDERPDVRPVRRRARARGPRRDRGGRRRRHPRPPAWRPLRPRVRRAEDGADGSEQLEAELRQYVAQTLPDPQVPREIVFVDELPIVGRKVSRHELRERPLAGRPLWEMPPTSEPEMDARAPPAAFDAEFSPASIERQTPAAPEPPVALVAQPEPSWSNRPRLRRSSSRSPRSSPSPSRVASPRPLPARSPSPSRPWPSPEPERAPEPVAEELEPEPEPEPEPAPEPEPVIVAAPDATRSRRRGPSRSRSPSPSPSPSSPRPHPSRSRSTRARARAGAGTSSPSLSSPERRTPSRSRKSSPSRSSPRPNPEPEPEPDVEPEPVVAEAASPSRSRSRSPSAEVAPSPNAGAERPRSSSCRSRAGAEHRARARARARVHAPPSAGRSPDYVIDAPDGPPPVVIPDPEPEPELGPLPDFVVEPGIEPERAADAAVASALEPEEEEDLGPLPDFVIDPSHPRAVSARPRLRRRVPSRHRMRCRREGPTSEAEEPTCRRRGPLLPADDGLPDPAATTTTTRSREAARSPAAARPPNSVSRSARRARRARRRRGRGELDGGPLEPAERIQPVRRGRRRATATRRAARRERGRADAAAPIA